MRTSTTIRWGLTRADPRGSGAFRALRKCSYVTLQAARHPFVTSGSSLMPDSEGSLPPEEPPTDEESHHEEDHSEYDYGEAKRARVCRGRYSVASVFRKVGFDEKVRPEGDKDC